MASYELVTVRRYRSFYPWDSSSNNAACKIQIQVPQGPIYQTYDGGQGQLRVAFPMNNLPVSQLAVLRTIRRLSVITYLVYFQVLSVPRSFCRWMHSQFLMHVTQPRSVRSVVFESHRRILTLGHYLSAHVISSHPLPHMIFSLCKVYQWTNHYILAIPLASRVILDTITQSLLGIYIPPVYVFSAFRISACIDANSAGV